MVTGRLKKQIAFEIGISEIAAKASRGQVVRKMNAATPPALARMADKLNLTEEVRKLSSPRMSSARSSSRTITAGHHSGFCRVSQLLATRKQ